MCGGAVQQFVDGGVCGVCIGVGDEHAGGGEWYELHGVRCGAVQQRVDGGVRGVFGGSVSGSCRKRELLGVCGGVCDGDTGASRRDELHGVCGGAVQQRVDGGVRQLHSRVGDKRAG
jgi:hypothetical protein